MILLAFGGFLLCLLLIYIIIDRGQNSQFPEEKGAALLYQEKFVSGSIGWVRASYAIRFAIYTKFLVIKSANESFLLYWSDIEKVELKNSFLVRSLLI